MNSRMLEWQLFWTVAREFSKKPVNTNVNIELKLRMARITTIPRGLSAAH